MARWMALVLAAVVLTGCGGDETSPSEEYANGVCSNEQAIDSGGGLPAIAAQVSAAISAAANAVNTVYQDLQGLDPAGELRDAFESSDDCNALGDQLNEIRS